MFIDDGQIEGVIVRKLSKFIDSRGWLMEFLRHDEIEEELLPVMGYLSATKPGIARGPHEHILQTDYFCFPGPSTFLVYMWDNRKESSTYMHKMKIRAGEDNPLIVIVPPKVVHAYKNIGSKEGIVINCPNALYKGLHKKDPVDEVRYEEDKNSPFILE